MNEIETADLAIVTMSITRMPGVCYALLMLFANIKNDQDVAKLSPEDYAKVAAILTDDATP
jgi:hypothetical protein